MEARSPGPVMSAREMKRRFISYHNKFYAYPYGNACIKALTSEVKNPAYKTGIYTENGEDVYYVDGTRRHDTGLVEVDGVRYYMNDGVVQKEETVVMQEDGTWYTLIKMVSQMSLTVVLFLTAEAGGRFETV